MNARGFSLLEVLVAFAVLSLTLGVLLRIFGGGAQMSAAADERARAILLADSTLARVGTELPLNEGVTDGEIEAGYNYQLSVAPWAPPAETGVPDNLPLQAFWIELTVLWGDEPQQPHRYTLSTLRVLAKQNALGAPGTAPNFLQPGRIR